MFDALLSGLFTVFSWPTAGFLVLGVLIGIVCGAIPGLSGVLGLVLLLPFTFSMEPVAAFALLLGMYAVTTTSDSISSILLGIPGTAASQATILDGYPLTKKGQAQRAFGAAYTVSAFGGVLGAVLLAASLPFVLPILSFFGTPELLTLGVLALVMVGVLSGQNKLKGLAVACFGLLLACIGYGETVAIPRYSFGTSYLLEELPLIPAVLGFFAIPEILDLATRNRSISRVPEDQVGTNGVLQGMRDALRNWWLAVRCSVLGTYVGILPGLGGPVSDWLAYGYAARSAKDRSQFGKGDIRGVIAPEAANNATKAGALLPTIAFGIPGSLPAAILLGALLIQGLRPGPDMLTTNLDLTYSMIWSIVIANILAAALLILLSKQLAKVIFLPAFIVVPPIVLFVFMGAWQGQSHIGDWVVCVGMGILGYFMKQGGWPRPPLVLALILGGLLERFAVVTVQAYPDFSWLTRPLVLGLLAVLLFVVVQSVLRYLRGGEHRSDHVQMDDTESHPVISLLLALGFVALFAWAAVEAWDWPRSASLLPVSVSLVGLGLAVAVLVGHVLKSRSAAPEAASAPVQKSLMLGRSAGFLALLAAIVPAAVFIGQKLALLGFIVFYLRRWSLQSWRVVALFLGGAWLVLTLFYDQVLNTLWHEDVLRTAVVAALSDPDVEGLGHTFEGQTITIISASPPGTGIDIGARVIAQYLPQHLPGNPTIIVQNAAGAGGNQGRNQVYERGPGDGTSLVYAANALQDQLLGAPDMRYDHRDLSLIGAMANLPSVSYIRRDVLGSENPAEIVDISDLKLGGTRPESSLDMLPRAALESLRLEYNYVLGYQGNTRMTQAVRNGEVHMATTSGANMLRVLLPTMADEIVPLWYYPLLDAAGRPMRNAILEEAGVPNFLDVYAEIHDGSVPDGPAWEALKFILEVRSIATVLWGPPQVDENVLRTMRTGFEQMFSTETFTTAFENAYGIGTTSVPIAEAERSYRALDRFDAETIAYWRGLIGL